MARRCSGMDILTRAECRQHPFILSHMRNDAQLDLRVIDGEQYIAFAGDKSMTKAPTFFRADGYILQVRIDG